MRQDKKLPDDWRGGFSWRPCEAQGDMAQHPSLVISKIFFLVGNPAWNWFLYLLHNCCSEEMVIRDYKLNINNWTEEEVEECTDDILLESQCYGQTVTTLKLVLIFFPEVWICIPTNMEVIKQSFYRILTNITNPWYPKGGVKLFSCPLGQLSEIKSLCKIS